MKTVPSLVASSTVGVAAVGLAIGKPESSTPSRPSSKKRKAKNLADLHTHRRDTSSPASRPGTSSTVITPNTRPVLRTTSSSPNAPIIHQQPPMARTNAQNVSGGRRLSVVKSGEFSPVDQEKDELQRRDSISSRGSWIKRLSTLQNSSPRSSVGPDFAPLNTSHGSEGPILSDPASSPASLPPNKLVKRATSGTATNGLLSRSRSKTQLPTLRRPATSHQRSVTLKQQFVDDAHARSSLETPSKAPQPIIVQKYNPTDYRKSWRQYFEARPTRLTKDRTSGVSSDGGTQTMQSMSRRVIPNDKAHPTLIKPDMINHSIDQEHLYYDETFGGENEVDMGAEFLEDDVIRSTELSEEPQKRARRSLSMHFSSPSSWITRSGSLRASKRNDGRGGGKRHSSAPVSTLPGRNTASAHGANKRHHAITDPTVFHRQSHTSAENSPVTDPFALSFQARTRNSSSPLPPLSRLSSFNLDLARLGLSSSSSSAPRRSPTSPLPQSYTAATSISSLGHASPVSRNYFHPHVSKTPRTSEFADRASTLVGSDNDTKGFISGDEDDMDFQSETVYDSLRSGATGSLRSHNTPLDSMFDESPPSLNGHSKNKRLSIHEMLINGGFQEGNSRIVEEDEGMSTPVKGSRSSPDDSETPVRLNATKPEDIFMSSPPTFSLAAKDFSRLSLDDEDDDEDWTRDDENLDFGNLSPPSSMNSRKLSPTFRAALADVTHSGSTNGNYSTTERPKSNLFDWSEPSSAEKLDYNGNSPRPRTAHVKQIADGRGGRAIGRRGPTALHIRSQSVPVVPDVAGQREVPKMTPKFGTWGLGKKGVSEDWDNDFDFESRESDSQDDEDTKMENSGMLVPPAIQASQANVVGHVGQIREICLLVEDLKRLRLLAKDKGLLTGSSAHLWKEAEGIIALAVPEEEDPTLSPPQSPISTVFDRESMDEKHHEQGFDAEDIENPEVPVEVLDRIGLPTGFVYDGSTVRRRSVFSPDDDIFGAGVLNPRSSKENLRPSTSTQGSSMKSTSAVARSVMETMHQHRSTSDPLLTDLTSQASNKMPFDTTSLRDLVHRANFLTRALSDTIRKADGSHSPEFGPHRESSPAFTRVFTDPMQSPPKHLPRSQSNNSMLGGSIDASPTRSLGQRVHMMTVA